MYASTHSYRFPWGYRFTVDTKTKVLEESYFATLSKTSSSESMSHNSAVTQRCSFEPKISWNISKNSVSKLHKLHRLHVFYLLFAVTMCSFYMTRKKASGTFSWKLHHCVGQTNSPLFPVILLFKEKCCISALIVLHVDNMLSEGNYIWKVFPF